MTEHAPHVDEMKRHLADAIRDGDRKRAADAKAELDKLEERETVVRPPEERA